MLPAKYITVCGGCQLLNSKSSHKSGVVLIEIDASQSGQRLDNFLVKQLDGIPRTRVYRIIRKGEVRVNGGRRKPEYKLAAGDTVRIPPLRIDATDASVRRPGRSQIERLQQAVLFENQHLLVIDKPTGIAVHAGSGVDYGIIDILRAARPDENLELVHRLDRDTSGCLMLARSRAALLSLQQQLKRGGIGKKYRALVMGRWPAELTEIDRPLRRYHLSNGERRVRVDPQGKKALTHIQVLACGAEYSELRLEILTGRTHQIRVHCQAAGHPIAGDDKYGDAEFNRRMRQRGVRRLMLHAASLELPETDYTPELVINAPLPPEFDKFNRSLQATHKHNR